MLISCGFRNDKRLNVWNWETKKVIACNTTSSKIYSISACNSFFVTCGEKHLMVWNLESINSSSTNLQSPRVNESESKNISTVPISPRYATKSKVNSINIPNSPRRKSLVPTSNNPLIATSLPSKHSSFSLELNIPLLKSNFKTLEGRSVTVGCDFKGLLFTDVKISGKIFYCLAHDLIFSIGEDRKVITSKHITDNLQLLCLSNEFNSKIAIGGIFFYYLIFFFLIFHFQCTDRQGRILGSSRHAKF